MVRVRETTNSIFNFVFQMFPDVSRCPDVPPADDSNVAQTTVTWTVYVVSLHVSMLILGLKGET